MEQVRHKTHGFGDVIRREEVNGFTYLWARYADGKEVKLCLPISFEKGAVEALGTLKDEVDFAIAEKKARLAAIIPARIPTASTWKTSARNRVTHTPAYTAVNPIARDFEHYLIDSGFKTTTDSGYPSTVYHYLNGVEAVLAEEDMSWDELTADIEDIVHRYDAGGAKQLLGAYGHRTVIAALKQVAQFAGV